MSIAIDVFPAQQGFPRPPDNGQPAPTSTRDVNVNRQAFAPAPLVNPFPIEPTPPAGAFLPASQGVPPVPVLSTVIPPALEVNLMEDDSTSDLNAPTFVVTDLGSFNINPGLLLATYTIVSVTDYDTGLPPTAASLNLRIVLSGLAPLSSFGFTFSLRSLFFTSGAWIVPPQPDVPERVISVWGDASGGNSVVVVPNQDANGVPFSWPSGPTAGDTVELDTARQDSEVVFQQSGIVQNVVPSTTPHFPGEQVAGIFTVGPLIPEPGDVETLIAVQEIDVSDQETVVGTPANYKPGIKL